MKSLLFILPSVITTLSVAGGFLSLVYTSAGNFTGAAWLIIFSIFMDALDGRVARATRNVTEFGEQYDSLADVMSFGVAPAFLIFNLMYSNGININLSFISSFLIILAGALRLARFNITSNKKGSFEGMPIPGCAGIITSYVLFCDKYDIDIRNGILIFLCLWVSFLMISNFPYPSGKEGKKGRGTRKLIMLSVITVILVTQPVEFFAFVGGVYMIYGPLAATFKKLRA
jgi:CDP-diacylglycerol--serine O-phosphatidyltransferase